MPSERSPEGSDAGPGPSTCRRCSNKLAPDANYCSNCGASRLGLAPAPPDSGGGMPTILWVLIILGGCLILGVVLSAIIAAIAIPNMIGTRKMRNETSAVGALRTISSAQARFREADRDADGVLDYASSLKELSQVGLIDNLLGSGAKSGYVFSLSGGTFEWRAAATPASPSTGTRNFIICVDGVVRFSGGGPATCSSPAIQ